jgi:transposase
MSLHPQPLGEIPSQTILVAQSAFPKGNIYLRMRDELGVFYEDKSFSDLFSAQGQPAYSPWRLALITIMQFVEGLTDRQAADAVRSRIDWKYALGLELTDSGFDFSVLSQFRHRLIEGGTEQYLFEGLLDRFREKGLLKAPHQQRTDSTHVLARIRILSRLEIIGETLRYALNTIAAVAPNWLEQIVPDPDWYERYGQRLQENRLPSSKEERKTLAEQMGTDGFYLLDTIWSESAPGWLRSIEAVEILRQVWIQQFYLDSGSIQLREPSNCPPAAILINSPYDPDARRGNKRTREWTGYKVHLSETCDEDAPHLITYVETVSSTSKDHQVTENVHQTLAEGKLSPQKHLVDAGYIDAQLLVDSQNRYDLDLIGPAPGDSQWQSKAGKGFGLANFDIDWNSEVVRCRRGKSSGVWKERLNHYQQPVIYVRFKKADCQNCPFRSDCTRDKTGVRTITLRPQQLHETLFAARARQQTAEFKKQYAARAGIEGTISQGTRAFGLRRCRYRGWPKTRLQHIITATAINLVRVWSWWTGANTLGTRPSRFSALGKKKN